jgi:hypothetical protein
VRITRRRCGPVNSDSTSAGMLVAVSGADKVEGTFTTDNAGAELHHKPRRILRIEQKYQLLRMKIKMTKSEIRRKKLIG